MDTCFRLVYGMAVQLLGGNGIHCRCAVPYHNQPGGFVPARVPAGSAYYGSLVMAASRVFDDCYSAYRLEPRADIQLRHLYPQLLDDPAFALVVPVQISSLAYPAYYYGLLISAPILSIWVWLFSSTINPLAAYKHRFGVTKTVFNQSASGLKNRQLYQ